MGAVRGLPLSACLQNCLHAFLHFLFLHLPSTRVDGGCALVSHGVTAEGRSLSGSSVTQTVQKRLLCAAVTSRERVIKASAAFNQI